MLRSLIKHPKTRRDNTSYKALFGIALLYTTTEAIAGPLDYNRVNLTADMLFNDEDTSQVINLNINERLENGFFYVLNPAATFVESENIKSLHAAWGYSHKASNVDFALSLAGTREWLSSGSADTEKTYHAKLTLPLATNFYVELGYKNTFLEDYTSESYSLGLEGGKVDGFQWELTTQPKENDENLRADFYIPTQRDGKWVIGASVINSETLSYGIHGGYHWLFGATTPRKAAAIVPLAASAVAENDPEGVDPIAPERIDEFAGIEDKILEELQQMEADAADMEPVIDDSSHDSDPSQADDYDDDLDFLFE